MMLRVITPEFRSTGEYLKRLLKKLALSLMIPSLAAGLLTACGGANSNNDSDKSEHKNGPTVPANQLVQSDLAALPNISTAGPVEYDALTGGVFTQVFGGNGGADLVRYLNERVHYYVDRNDDDNGVIPSHFAIDGWEKDETHNTSVTPAARDDSFLNQRFLTQDGSVAVIGAVNIGTQLWLDGLINNVDVTIRLGRTFIPVESSRVGLVVLGEGYTDRYEDSGESIEVPAFIRQGILLHEARHSDCTGGVTESDLNLARNVNSAQEFARKTKMTSCGHLHSFCPKNMKGYANLPACDSEPWGAYSVEATFLSAMTFQDLNTVEKNAAFIGAIDRANRVQVGMYGSTDRQKKQVKLQIMGTPDMSSSGYRADH